MLLNLRLIRLYWNHHIKWRVPVKQDQHWFGVEFGRLFLGTVMTLDPETKIGVGDFVRGVLRVLFLAICIGGVWAGAGYCLRGEIGRGVFDILLSIILLLFWQSGAARDVD